MTSLADSVTRMAYNQHVHHAQLQSRTPLGRPENPWSTQSLKTFVFRILGALVPFQKKVAELIEAEEKKGESTTAPTFSGGINDSEHHAFLSRGNSDLLNLISSISQLGRPGAELLGVVDASDSAANSSIPPPNNELGGPPPQPDSSQVADLIATGNKAALSDAEDDPVKTPAKKNKRTKPSYTGPRKISREGSSADDQKGTAGVFSDVLSAIRDQVVGMNKTHALGESYLNALSEAKLKEAEAALLSAKNKSRELDLAEAQLKLQLENRSK